LFIITSSVEKRIPAPSGPRRDTPPGHSPNRVPCMRIALNNALVGALAPLATRTAGVVRSVIARNGGELPAAPH